MAVDRRTLWLGMAVIAGLFVAAVVWTSGGSTGEQPPAPARTRPAPSDSKAVADAPPGHVNLDALEVARREPADSRRNPFRFQPKVVAPPVTPPGPPRPMNQGPIMPTVPLPPPGPPQPPPIPLKFIALFTRPDGKRVAVLSDGRSSPQGGKEGDIILGQYMILKIGNESIEMSYIDGRGRQMIKLTGQ